MSKSEHIAIARNLCLATHIESDQLEDVLKSVDSMMGEGDLERSIRHVAQQVAGKDLVARARSGDIDTGWADSVCWETGERFKRSLDLVQKGGSVTVQLWVDLELREPVLWRKQNGDAATAIGFRALTSANDIVFPEATVYSVRPLRRQLPIGYVAGFPLEVYPYFADQLSLYPQQILTAPQINIRSMKADTEEMIRDWKPYSRLARAIRKNR